MDKTVMIPICREIVARGFKSRRYNLLICDKWSPIEWRIKILWPKQAVRPVVWLGLTADEIGRFCYKIRKSFMSPRLADEWRFDPVLTCICSLGLGDFRRVAGKLPTDGSGAIRLMGVDDIIPTLEKHVEPLIDKVQNYVDLIHVLEGNHSVLPWDYHSKMMRLAAIVFVKATNGLDTTTLVKDYSFLEHSILIESSRKTNLKEFVRYTLRQIESLSYMNDAN